MMRSSRSRSSAAFSRVPLAALLAGALLLSVTAGANAGAPQQSAAAAGATAPVGPDPAEQAPEGATDGLAVGDRAALPQRVRVPAGVPDQPSATAAATAQRRYFGSGPWAAIGSAAGAATKCTGLTAAELRAMAVAPIFKESAGGTTPGGAPAPMTLSRYDEWSGTRAGNTNVNANYGLYAFRNPYTPYHRAYWHPGIGIWQYDSAGVGAPFTAAERMDVSVISGDVVGGMRDRWCSPGYYVDHAAPFSEAERRAAAWAPWWYTDNGGCPLCESAYQDMAPGTTRAFANVSTVAMSNAGGAQKRTCRLSGVAGTVACWYIDPAKAQGATWWAGLSPRDGGRPTDAPAPLSTPFYDVKIAGQERRYWLRADTGYSVDISGARTLGKNARPKNNQPGSGVTWSSGGVLCDVSGRRGACDPSIPPPGVVSSALTVNGAGYTVRSLDANGDGRGDLLFYDSTTGKSVLSTGSTTAGAFTSTPLALLPKAQLVVADIDGDGGDDVVTYAPGSRQVQIRRVKAKAPVLTRGMGGGRILFAIDSNGDRKSELIFYGPTTTDIRWSWNGSKFSDGGRNIVGTYTPLVGDFDGNGLQDILWYRPGTGQDLLWRSRPGAAPLTVKLRIDGRHRPLVGDFDGNAVDDILWYTPGSGGDAVWFGNRTGSFTQQRAPMGGDYRPVRVDLPSDGRDDVLWFGPGAVPDRWTRWTAQRARTTSVVELGGTQTPVGGRFGSAGRNGIFWYGSGTASDWLWR